MNLFSYKKPFLVTASIFISIILSSSPLIALAGEADVLEAKAFKKGDTYTFKVTVAHEDEGWSHYANMWEVVSLDGKVLAVRVLVHPHETEQPFTRSLSGIELPKGTKSVIIRANDSVHELGGKTFRINLPQ